MVLLHRDIRVERRLRELPDPLGPGAHRLAILVYHDGHLTTVGEPPERTDRLIVVQRRQCQTDPRPPTDRDADRRLSDYSAGYADGQSDAADASLRTE